jgi:hypothetical protein
LYMGSPTATVAVITVTACVIVAALPNFWTVPAQFLTGASAGFGSYVVPMFAVGGLIVLSGILMVWLSRKGRVETTGTESDSGDQLNPDSEMIATGPVR